MRLSIPDKISENNKGFTINSVVGDETHFIDWSAVETILFSPNRYGTDCAEWIIYLSKPPKITLKPDAWWLNKLTFIFTSKTNKKIRIRDDINIDFYNFPAMVKKHLNQSAEINYEEDNRKGNLISKKITVKDSKTITVEHWKPKRSIELPWKILYERYNRSVQEIYDRDGSI